ncbi:MAG: CHAT domain-containing protein [Flavobacteriaceae bacterium]|nr:CHAT domain-containing protein [Flavobacteriaceae bacterium]
MIAFLRKYWGICAVFICCHSFSGYGQNTDTPELSTIENLLSENKITEAETVLQQKLSSFLSNNQIDSLYQFPIYIGKIEAKKGTTETAAKAAEDFIANLKSRTSNPRTLFKAYRSLDKLYVNLGDDASSVIASKKALEYARQTSDITQKELGEINYAIGGNYYAMYNLSNAVNYFKASVTAYEKSNSAKKEKLADAYNGVAVYMWTLNKLDSAEVYFHKAIATTKESKLEAFDRDYYIVTFQFNLALVVDAQGHLGAAIELKKELISKLQTIINGSPDEVLVKKAKRLQASAISNLAAFYNDTGYFARAYKMLKYAHKKKKELYGVDSPRLGISSYQIATSEVQLREFDKSIATANEALVNLKKAQSRYLSVEGDLLYILAKAYSEKKEIKHAKELYEESEALYNEAYPTEYSREYLILLRDYALFLAENNEPNKAIALAEKVYDYIRKNNGEDSFPIIKEITNRSQVYFAAGDYANSYQWANKGNRYLDQKISQVTSILDSIQIEYYRPTITVLEVQSLLKTKTSIDTLFLKEQVTKIEKAVFFLEKRKTTTINIEDINSLLTEYKSLNSLSKQLYYRLYKATKQPAYLDKTIAIQESGIYNRIRTKFNIRKNIRFGGIPSKLKAREKELKQLISSALKTDEEEKIKDYFKANEAWNTFLDSLKHDYPKYYQLRYSTIEQPITNLQKSISENTTVVRYFFIETQLYALVVSKTEKKLIELDSENLDESITQLGENQGDLSKVAPLYHQLYLQLWEPLKTLVNSENVVIVPDGILFNLSFETLTPSQINSFQELGTNSLLANYFISYNYSLLLLDEAQKSIDYSSNFVAFAPEFTDKMKKDYQIGITDSLELDKTYLTLLPQHFSVDIAKRYSKQFNGTSFLNEKSTKQLFTTNAKEHKIIHIATHAESNNMSPQLSRLVFAKDSNDKNGLTDNYLYTYEIYNQNLSSNLAILTACETGKPTYQPGQGMISLAHAFNYAGSESTLTSLWKIDEKSSTEIIGHFYENLKKGWPKNQALRQAKLTYLASAEGRTAEPQYWAGLVLMGNAAPIQLSSRVPIWIWILGSVLLLFLLFYFFKTRRT